MYYFSVFCFKQKTAYEMRISDWSSDVCSSDLERYGLVMAGAPSLLVETWVSGWARARGTPPPERHRDGFRVEVGAPDQRTRYVFPAVSATLTRLAEDIRLPGIYQIGSASWRARVCQYV